MACFGSTVKGNSLVRLRVINCPTQLSIAPSKSGLDELPSGTGPRVKMSTAAGVKSLFGQPASVETKTSARRSLHPR